jgi:phage major head subunit gpT-like protein
MSLIRENFIELEGSIQKVFDNFKKQKTDYLPMLFNYQKSTRAQENHLGMGALQQMQPWTGEVSYDDFAKGYKQTYRHAKYSTGVQVQRELMDDEEYGEIKKRANKVALAVHKTLQTQAASVFNNAFNTSFTGPDGAALGSALHKHNAADAAQNNTGTYDLTVDNLETIMIKMREFEDDRGDIMDVTGRLIICGEYWRKTAKQICGSDKEPFDSDNQMNIYKDEMNYLCVPWITGKKWFLTDPDSMKGGDGLNWYMRRDPRSVEYVDDFDTEVGKYKAVGRWSYGWDTWYWVFCNNPA